MQNIYKKMWLSIIAATTILGLVYMGNAASAEEFTYYGCSVNETGSGDFQTLDSCDLMDNMAWCNINSGAINISYDECISLAYLYEETNGDSRTYNGGWFSSTDVATWQGAAPYGDNFGLIISGGHVTDVQLLNNNLNGAIISGLNNLSYMTRLALNFNNISSINLSNNTGIQTLFIGYNPISSIDVSANTALKFIYIDSSNISSIDLSTNINLEQFIANSTAFTGVDLSNNPHIKTLKLGSTNVESIDVSSYTGLEDLALYNTAITGIDLSNNPALKYLQLQNCTGIEYLDLSYNTGLIELELHDMSLNDINLTNLSVLRYLNIDNNPLGGLDISEAPALEQLSAINTNLSSINLSNNPLLISVSVSDNELSELDITNNTNLYNLNVSNNAISSLTVSGNNAYDLSGSFNLDYNALCNGTGDMNEYNFLTTYAPNWNTKQYCHIPPADVYEGNQAVQISWRAPKDFGSLDELDGYYTAAQFSTGTEFMTGSFINSRTFAGNYIINGQIYTFTVCAVYSSGQITRCTEIQAVPNPATPYVLTEITPVDPIITSTSATYSFYVSGSSDVLAETLVSDCGRGSDVLAEAIIANSAMSIAILDLEVGQTYQCEVYIRLIPGMEESNHLQIGPFTIVRSSNGGGGGAGATMSRTPSITPAMWKAFYSEHMNGATSTIGDTFTVKAFITDVFALLGIKKPINRKPEHESQEVPQKLVNKVMQVLVKLLAAK